MGGEKSTNLKQVWKNKQQWDEKPEEKKNTSLEKNGNVRPVERKGENTWGEGQGINRKGKGPLWGKVENKKSTDEKTLTKETRAFQRPPDKRGQQPQEKV